MSTVHNQIKKERRDIKLLDLNDIISARTEYMAGASLQLISEKLNVSKQSLLKKIELLGNFLVTNNNSLTVEQQEIKAIILPKIQEMQETLAKNSYDIILKADEHTKVAINSICVDAIDAARISEIHSKRLARIKDIEINPEAPKPVESTKVIQIIQNIFN
jgi:predicted DNA-binding protein YlxM (UPF0122 family)